MKKYILFFIFLCIIPFNSFAENYDVCTDIHTLACKVMEARQIGIPITRMLEIVEPEFRFIVIEAFKVPKFSTKEFQQAAIDKFGEEAFLGCYEAINKKR